MKIDWEKAKQIAAKRFEDVITACNEHDKDKLLACMDCSLASPEDYMLEDKSEPKRCYLDKYNCFITDNGYICKMVQQYSPDDINYLLPYLAVKVNYIVCWVTAPCKVEIEPEYNENPFIVYTDELTNAIHTTINHLASVAQVFPATHDEVKANAMV